VVSRVVKAEESELKGSERFHFLPIALTILSRLLSDVQWETLNFHRIVTLYASDYDSDSYSDSVASENQL